MAALDPEVVRTVISDLDGWGIKDAAALVRAGLPPELVASVTREHRSAPVYPPGSIGDLRDPGAIYDRDGKPVEALVGVLDLELLRAMCRALGLDERTSYIGRGKDAAELVRRLRVWLSAQLPVESADG